MNLFAEDRISQDAAVPTFYVAEMTGDKLEDAVGNQYLLFHTLHVDKAACSL